VVTTVRMMVMAMVAGALVVAMTVHSGIWTNPNFVALDFG